MTEWKKYLLWFAQDHIDFKYPELKSLLELWNIPFRFPSNDDDCNSHAWKLPYCEIELPNDEYAKELASRSTLIRFILELWTVAETFENFHSNLKTYINNNIKNEHFGKIFDKNTSFKITVETYNKHYTQKEKIDKIETLNYLPVNGGANLKNPDVEWYYIEFHGIDPMNVPPSPGKIFFGKWLTDSNRSMIKEISLKTRKFIGNTSMDPTLSLMMVNQALVKPGDFIYDPFVGSGSLLVAAAKCGAYVGGADIDFQMLHGRTKPTRINTKKRENDECILSNLKQYNCAGLYVDVVVSDFPKPIWRNEMLFDSIITDPPYGIREATEKIETKNRRQMKEENPDIIRYPSTSNYNLANIYSDLLKFSLKHLRLGGRLVCWIPIIKCDYTEKLIPQHSCFTLISNSEQNISILTSRRLLTYEKVSEPDEDAVEIVLDEITDFRTKFFSAYEDTREDRRMQRAKLRETGRQEAIKRGKIVNKNGKVVNKINE